MRTQSVFVKSWAVGAVRVWGVGAGPKEPYNGVRFTGLRRMFSESWWWAPEEELDGGIGWLRAMCVQCKAAAMCAHICLRTGPSARMKSIQSALTLLAGRRRRGV